MYSTNFQISVNAKVLSMSVNNADFKEFYLAKNNLQEVAKKLFWLNKFYNIFENRDTRQIKKALLVDFLLKNNAKMSVSKKCHYICTIGKNE